jgi:hypothetical protein
MAQKRNWSRATLAQKVAEIGFTPSAEDSPSAPLRGGSIQMGFGTETSPSKKTPATNPITHLQQIMGRTAVMEMLTIIQKGIDSLSRAGDYRTLERGIGLIPLCEQRDSILALFEEHLGVSARMEDRGRLSFVKGQKLKHKSLLRTDLLYCKVQMICGETT